MRFAIHAGMACTFAILMSGFGCRPVANQNAQGTGGAGQGGQTGGAGGNSSGGQAGSGGAQSGGTGGAQVGGSGGNESGGVGGSQSSGAGGTQSGGSGGTRSGVSSGSQAGGSGGGAGGSPSGGSSGTFATGGNRTGGSDGSAGSGGSGGSDGGPATGGNRTGGIGGGTGGGSGTGTSATGGQTSGAGGTSGTVANGGSTGTPSCTNNLMDGTETGVDCGGSCAACPNYKINAPNLKNNAATGCSGGPGFMCTRSMVFSSEFKQAANDDWGGTGDAPFVYGAVGHDLDSGGVDKSSGNTCCQCYQLVFVSTSDAVTGLPTPKPMIVQSFNTAAGGPKNFDIYMATGGEGANTSGCTAMYDNYPSIGQPNNGGIRVVNYSSQCSSTNKYTLASVSSSTCQNQIAKDCGTLTSASSPINQTSSQNSCIETSQPESMYHLNWKVRAKRVECPTNLTRVTGCKLASQGLPQADPTAKDDASASSFASGYTTTTMQDCCRPTCAWNANVTQSGSAIDGSYGAFYTCDKAGNPS